jgi:MinD-like ATPase involved in chromosome partitioning or flagellar assembly
MIIAVWGRDGTGKSTLCDTLGALLAKQGVTAVIDTDLTQPTLPARVNGRRFDADTSLGKAISGIGTGNAAPYLHQHPKNKNLFYAGLTDRDEYLSYELGLEADDAAQDFVEQCAELSDTVILDLSGQRSDPFLPCALVHADKVIVLITPDVQGVCWFNSVKQLLTTMNAQGRVLPAAAMTDRRHELSAIEKAADARFAAALPYTREFRQIREAGVLPTEGATPGAVRYLREAKKLYALLKGADGR